MVDPIIKDLHQQRKAFARQFDFDPKRILEDLKKREKTHANLVRRAPKLLVPVEQQ